MKNFYASLIGLVTTFSVMTLFEFVNSLIHPFPTGINTSDLNAVREFTSTLPISAFLVVIFGWAVGSFVGGYVLTKYAKRRSLNTILLVNILGVLLTVFGCINNFIFLPGVQPVWFNIVGLPMFIIFTRLGYEIARK
jgi:hypothetical protein